MKPGIYHDLSNEEYHGGPGISKSHLDAVADNPRKYWQAYVNPERAPREPTPAMVIGTAIHAAILEPDLFSKTYVVAPDISRRSNAGKEEYARWLEDHEGAIVLTQEQYDTAVGAADSVLSNHEALDLLSHGSPEESFFAIEPDTGELVKCRTDWRHPERGIVDVKSTEDASPDGFIRSVFKYNYHVQVAWYRDVIEAALDAPAPADWVFIAVEKTPPYAVGLYRVPEAMVRAGRQLARERLNRIVECRRTNTWPDYNAGAIVELEPPGWMAKRLGLNSPEVEFA